MYLVDLGHGTKLQVQLDPAQPLPNDWPSFLCGNRIHHLIEQMSSEHKHIYTKHPIVRSH